VASAIATAEAFGTASVQRHVMVTGIASAEAFGTPAFTLGAVSRYFRPPPGTGRV
jgi:hypothetical protein